MVSRAIALCGTEQVDPPMRTLTRGTACRPSSTTAPCATSASAASRCCAPSPSWCATRTGAPSRPIIENLRSTRVRDGFTVTYRGTCADATRDARLRGDGSPAGATARWPSRWWPSPKTDVLTNRTGFIVLHPIEGVAGQPVKVLHVDGREETIDAFRRRSTRHARSRDIRALSHEIAPGIWATCTMEGDAFEMEDQRNWSDASYKTYVRPLRSPGPTRCRRARSSRRRSGFGFGNAAAAGRLSADKPRSRLTIGGAIGRLPGDRRRRPGRGGGACAGNRRARSSAWRRSGWSARSTCGAGHGRAELERYRALGELTGAEVVLEIITRGSARPVGRTGAAGAGGCRCAASTRRRSPCFRRRT